MGPTEAEQIVADGFGQEAHLLVGLHAQRPVALGEFRAVGPVNQRDMRECRCFPAAGGEQVVLAEGVVQVVVAADRVGDAYVVVVHHDGQHVGGGAVGPQDDEIVQRVVGPGHFALDEIGDGGLAVQRHLDADHRIDARGRLGGIPVAPAAIVDPRGTAGFPGFLAHLGEFLGRAVAPVGLALREQLLGDFAVPVGVVRLVGLVPVPIECKPAQAVENGLYGLVGGALAVGILDPQQELPAVMLREEVVEERRARPADMQEAGGRGGKAGNDGHGGAALNGWDSRSYGGVAGFRQQILGQESPRGCLDGSDRAGDASRRFHAARIAICPDRPDAFARP